MCKEIREKFQELYSLDVNKYVEEKSGLKYLSWAFAWAEFKKIFPDAQYKVKKDEFGNCYFGEENTGYMVYTEVIAGGMTYEMWLPVMDNANKPLKRYSYTYSTRNGEKTVEAITMFDINKAVMRCLVKNLAMFGLGLYIYAGEDLPENIQEYICTECGKQISGVKTKDGVKTAKEVHDACGGLCITCYKKKTKEEKGE